MMLPSRGAIRSSQALRLRQIASPNRPRSARNFATSLRPHANSSSSSSRTQPSLLALAGRRTTSHPRASKLPSSTAAFSLSSLNPWGRSSSPPKADADATADPAAAAAPATPTLPPPSPQPPSSTAQSSAPADASTLTDPAASAAASSSPLTSGSADESAIAEILDGGALLDLPEQIGYLHALGLDFGWGPTSMCQWALEHVHVYSGLPWWGSLALSVLLFRAAIFLPSLTAAEQSARLQKLRQDPKFAAAMAEMQQAAIRGGSQAQSRALELRMTTKRMQAAAGVTTWKMFIPMINVPFGYGMFRLLRSMAQLPVPGLEDGGLLWFQDLMLPDPYFILPTASAAIMYLIFRNNIKYMAPEQAQMMKMVQIVITPISLIVTAKMSAGLTFFFFSSSLLQMIQTWLWHQPWLREWKGLPPLHTLIYKPGGDGPSAPPVHQLSPESTWQAPRAVAPSASSSASSGSSASAAASGPPSTVDVVKKGWNSMMGKAKDKQGASKEKQVLQKAEDYERKRALEEEEDLYRRRDAERQYREMKKTMAKAKETTR